KSWGANTKRQAEITKTDSLSAIKTDRINTEIPGVSNEVATGEIKDRFQSLQEAYKNDKDYSGISALGENQTEGSGYSSTYSQADIERIKTNQSFNNLTTSLDANRANLDRNMQKMLSRANQSNYNGSYNTGSYPDRTGEEIYNQLQNQP